MNERWEHLAIVAEVEESAAPEAAPEEKAAGTTDPLAELERRIAGIEQSIAGLQALREEAAKPSVSAASVTGRRTHASAPAGLHGKAAGTSSAVGSSSLDEALRGLSPEQRIAVKGQMIRAGLI